MIRVREYRAGGYGTGGKGRGENGISGPPVVLLHGGPGAPGYLTPLAEYLAASCRVLEPLQRGSGAEPLTVARHIADLHEVIENRLPGERPVLAGHSWGAMLALAYVAGHPDRIGALVLIGCGTFDPAARERLHEIRDRRMTAGLRAHLDRLIEEYPDPDERFAVTGDLLLPVYSCDVTVIALPGEGADFRAFQETWGDMLRLQAAGVYPAAFEAIRCPVLMLHGRDDPHPGPLIRDSLAPYLPQLQYREFENCGHYPWLERAAAEAFCSFLRAWITGQGEA